MEINFLGDSITEGAAASSPDKNYVSVAGKLLDAKTNNYGIGGTRIAKQTAPSKEAVYDRDFNGRVAETSKTADAVVVFGGTNDFGHGDAPFGGLTDRTEDTFCGACYSLFEKLRERFPKQPVLVILPLHRLEENVENKCKKICGSAPLLKEYREVLRRRAEEFQFEVLDLWKEDRLNPNTAVGAGNFWDGLHPNDEGHAILGSYVAESLRKMLE